jgi:hypothetical protein
MPVGVSIAGGYRPLRTMAPSDRGVDSVAISGSRKATATSEGATLVQPCKQVTVGAGHGVPLHSSQWLQGCPPIALFSVASALEAAAAATVMKPPASTARQLKKSARVRKRFMRA